MLFNYAVSFLAGASLIVPSASEVLDTSASLRASSEGGQRLLSKARLLNGERDVAWVSQYDIQYTGCSSLVQVRGEEGGGGGEEGILFTQNLVKFSLCPSGSSNCKNGADYVVNMMDFVQAYTENRQQEQEQICENIRENCYCGNNGDDDACAYQCYVEQGMEVCIEYEGQEEFEIDRYLECAEMEEGNNGGNGQNNYYNNGNNNGNNNNNNANANMWYGQTFIGPYCSPKDGKSILLGLFYDEGCSVHADASAYSKSHYGMELPYSKESIVKSERISCMQVEDNNNNNQNYYNNGNNNGNNNNNNNNYYNWGNYEVNEMCGQVYEQAARCESNLKINYGDTSGCEYIQKILPRLESATRSVANHSPAPGSTATAFAVAFLFTTILFAAYAFFLYRKLARKAIILDTL